MFLRPHSFQQAERYLERLVRDRVDGLRPFDWGYREVSIDESLLALGKISLQKCNALAPDGTPVRMPEDCDAPVPLVVPKDARNCAVFLGLPISMIGGVNVRLGDETEPAARYQALRSEAADVNTGARTTSEVDVARLNSKLLLETEERGGYICLGLCEIRECLPDGTIVLNEDYVAPVMDCRAAPQLFGFLNEILGLLNQRGEAVAARVSASGRGGAAEIADFLMLQVVNRWQPLFAHVSRSRDVHPESLYQYCLQLMGELATFTKESKRPIELATYDQEALRETFAPLMTELRHSLSMVVEQTAIQIPLEERQYGVHVGVIADPSLVSQASFVLAVQADLPADAVHGRFPKQVKIGPVEKIRDLVNLALPGIALNAMPVAPRQIPYHAGMIYFELDRSQELWRNLDQSGGLAVHVSGEFPGLEMALWAIKR